MMMKKGRRIKRIRRTIKRRFLVHALWGGYWMVFSLKLYTKATKETNPSSNNSGTSFLCRDKKNGGANFVSSVGRA
jgi:hypothetical protein